MKDFLEGRTPAANPASRKNPPPLPSSLPSLSSLHDVSIAQDFPQENCDPADATAAAAPPSEPPPLPEPQLELVHDAQGRIGHIVVTCRCGEKTILQCNY